MSNTVDKLEAQLDDFDVSVRKEALVQLKSAADEGNVEFVEPNNNYTNVHFHTFYSFNAEGYSPSKIAWLAKKSGLAIAGIVDFDVLDGLDEFYQAAALLNLKAISGIETRVFVPEFADKVINSPGEPGVAYHMGAGIPFADTPKHLDGFKARLCDIVKNRNSALIEKINKYLSQAELDYEKDVLPLAPAGNATERHITLAYARKAQQVFENTDELKKFWHDKLGTDFDTSELSESVLLLNTIRSKTMKSGGVGYVKPDAGTFPTMAEMNKFVLAAGGIPTLAWLDGTSAGEQEIEKLLEVASQTGVCAVNIIPDRNYTAGVGRKDAKCNRLYEFVEICEKLDLPIIAGTEMNSPGQKFVDDFQTDELKPFVEVFLKGALTVYAHTVLQRQCGFGYTSKWPKNNFNSRADKNAFFEELGRQLSPVREKVLSGLNENCSVYDILDKLK